MFLEFLLSPISDKNTCTGAILDSYSRSKTNQKESATLLKEREVKALEEIAKHLRNGGKCDV